MIHPLPIRPPAVQLRHAREDHAICLRLVASYRVRLCRGEPAMRGEHRDVLAHAAVLRTRFPALSVPARASPGV